MDRQVKPSLAAYHELARTINFSTMTLASHEEDADEDADGKFGRERESCDEEDEAGHDSEDTSNRNRAKKETTKTLQLTAVGPARAIEVPDDDNTLLFATRPKAIRPVGYHNDVHSANNSITFAATYTELLSPSEFGEMAQVEGGLRIWKCALHYYPHDKSARIVDPKWDDVKFSSHEWGKVKLPNRFKNARASCRRTWNNEVSDKTNERVEQRGEAGRVRRMR